MAIGSYSLGSLVLLASARIDPATGAFIGNGFETLVNGVWTATDPTTVVLKVQNPTGTVSTYTYALAEVTKSSTGIYYKGVPMAPSGRWLYQWTGTGACIAKGWAEINIESDPIG
jgi:hypothetical protein